VHQNLHGTTTKQEPCHLLPEGTFGHVYCTYTAPNGYRDEAAYQMEDTGLPAQESPSSAALHQEETAGCRIDETAALVA
jgi:hypothetical protein